MGPVLERRGGVAQGEGVIVGAHGLPLSLSRQVLEEISGEPLEGCESTRCGRWGRSGSRGWAPISRRVVSVDRAGERQGMERSRLSQYLVNGGFGAAGQKRKGPRNIYF
jgi:hypothetical protein